MGKCAICGKEARNCYSYYTGSIVDRDVIHDSAYSRSVKIRYEDVTECREYLCRKCEYDSLSLWLAGAAFCLVPFVLLFLNGVSHPRNLEKVWWVMLLLLLGMIVCLVRSRLFACLKDRPIDETEAAVRLILKARKAVGDSSPRIGFLTPGEFRELKPERFSLRKDSGQNPGQP